MAAFWGNLKHKVKSLAPMNCVKSWYQKLVWKICIFTTTTLIIKSFVTKWNKSSFRRTSLIRIKFSFRFQPHELMIIRNSHFTSGWPQQYINKALHISSIYERKYYDTCTCSYSNIYNHFTHLIYHLPIMHFLVFHLLIKSKMRRQR